jgi:hypothetical protein
MVELQIKVKTKIDYNDLNRRIKTGSLNALGHAGGIIRKTAQRSIQQRKDKTIFSMPGQPPFTHAGNLKNAIRYEVDKQKEVVRIGPTFTGIGLIGHIQEFGGNYTRGHYPPRPFMKPALDKIANLLPNLWANSIRG